ncbi:dCTP deaminase [Stenotrophomonas sp. 22692]|jgi:dUTP pyrophosphatase|uniref:dCTP deaminase n=1 Tax=Stenotrophomonas sp. 22692 TaxID=3453956 RepID=UPI003F8269C6
MIIPPRELIPLIRMGKIIQNLDSRELYEPEGVGFDLRLKSLSTLDKSNGRLSVKQRRTPDSHETHPIGKILKIDPGIVYLARTTEEFLLPDDLAATFTLRSTLFRSGVMMGSGVTPPGYRGPMTFSLFNQHSCAFEIEIGARFAHVVFHRVMGEVTRYRGQWNHGRTSQPEDEDQI